MCLEYEFNIMFQLNLKIKKPFNSQKYGAFRSIGAMRHQAKSMTSQRHD
jgi:hypothetical protein